MNKLLIISSILIIFLYSCTITRKVGKLKEPLEIKFDNYNFDNVLKDYKRFHSLNKRHDNLIAVYTSSINSLKKRKFYIIDYANLSDIYERPVTGYYLSDSVPVILYIKKKGFVNPDRYSSDFREYMTGFLHDDLIADSIVEITNEEGNIEWEVYNISVMNLNEPLGWYVNRKRIIIYEYKKEKLHKVFQRYSNKYYYGFKYMIYRYP